MVGHAVWLSMAHAAHHAFLEGDRLMALTRRTFIQRMAQLGGYSAAYSTMHAMGLIPLPGPSALPDLPGDYGKGKSVVILGAGIAGLVSAYELRKAGFTVTVIEARNKPGGRSCSVRGGDVVTFTDGTRQGCTWERNQYLNAGPARIPSHHTHLLDYCHELNVPLEVEINFSRSALMQADTLNGGKPVTERQVVHDTRGYMAELLSKAVRQHDLDKELSREETQQMLDFLRTFGDLQANGKYTGSTRAGFITPRGAGPVVMKLNEPLALKELLTSDLSKGVLYEEQIDWQATMFQPVGGMDRIGYGFAKVVGDAIIYEAPVEQIQTGPGSVTVSYTKAGNKQTVTADWCICTMPISVLAKTANNFTPATQKAFTGMPMTALYKIAWESPRFWEKDDRIYGGISFPKQTVDIVWYPSDRLFSPAGILIGGCSTERVDATGGLTPVGKMSTAEKLDASRTAVEKLHPGKGGLLAKPMYISWEKTPHSLGCYANNHLASSDAAYAQLDKLEGRTVFAGDYLSHLVGWQEGAALSAHRAIARIAGTTSA